MFSTVEHIPIDHALTVQEFTVFILRIVGFGGAIFTLIPLLGWLGRRLKQLRIGWRRKRLGSDMYLSSHEQLLELLNGDRQIVSQLINAMRHQYPHQTDAWYDAMVLEQMKLWIINKLSSNQDQSNRQGDTNFGLSLLAQYTLKYPDYPSWWIYRKLAKDYRLL